MDKILIALKDPCKILLFLLRKLSCYFTNDTTYLKIFYFLNQHQRLNLSNPQLFTEKIQWLKLYQRNPLYKVVVDKIKVKDYVKNIIGEKYIIPTICVFDDIDDIDLSCLPDKFVLKTNSGGGNNGIIVCTDKQKLNLKQAKAKLKKSMSYDIYSKSREWPYGNMEKKVFAEVYMQDGDKKDLMDYKFFCFNGKAMYCQVIADRNTDETIDFYDMEWNHQEFYGLNPVVGNAAKPAAKPAALSEMVEIANKLCNISPFLRVDMYYINGQVYFGEMTFYPNSGVGKFSPEIWNKKLGDLLILPIT